MAAAGTQRFGTVRPGGQGKAQRRRREEGERGLMGKRSGPLFSTTEEPLR
jgi:hypothetical protein